MGLEEEEEEEEGSLSLAQPALIHRPADFPLSQTNEGLVGCQAEREIREAVDFRAKNSPNLCFSRPGHFCFTRKRILFAPKPGV